MPLSIYYEAFLKKYVDEQRQGKMFTTWKMLENYMNCAT